MQAMLANTILPKTGLHNVIQICNTHSTFMYILLLYEDVTEKPSGY
jgi:hypothetical protein